MKLDEVQGMVPGGERPREVEGEVLGPEVQRSIESAAKTLADYVVTGWWQQCQKEWARGAKDDPDYERIGDLLFDRVDELERAGGKVVQQLSRRLGVLAREQAMDRAQRWASRDTMPRLTTDAGHRFKD